MTSKDLSVVVICYAAVIGALLLHCPVDTASPDSQHDVMTVCDGASASFSWPCDLQYDLAKIMTLNFKGLDGQGRLLATITSNGSVTISNEFSSRIRPRGTSGILIDSVGILDSGVYITEAEFKNGTVVERHFTLNVHMPPLLNENALTASIVNTSQGCQAITCGHIIFSGFPPVVFHWNTPQGSETHEAADGKSAIHGCPLVPGNYSCHLTGPALMCGKPRQMSDNAVAVIQMSAEMAKAAAAKKARQEQEELVLMIVVPIVSVMLPLIILGLWVLSHLLSGHSPSYSKVDSEAGFSAASNSNQSSPGPSSPTSPESVPLTSKPDGEEEEEEGEGCEDDRNKKGERQTPETEADGGEAEPDADLLEDIDADITTPLMDSGSGEHIHFVDDADETRL